MNEKYVEDLEKLKKFVNNNASIYPQQFKEEERQLFYLVQKIRKSFNDYRNKDRTINEEKLLKSNNLKLIQEYKSIKQNFPNFLFFSNLKRGELKFKIFQKHFELYKSMKELKVKTVEDIEKIKNFELRQNYTFSPYIKNNKFDEKKLLKDGSKYLINKYNVLKKENFLFEKNSKFKIINLAKFLVEYRQTGKTNKWYQKEIDKVEPNEIIINHLNNIGFFDEEKNEKEIIKKINKFLLVYDFKKSEIEDWEIVQKFTNKFKENDELEKKSLSKSLSAEKFIFNFTNDFLNKKFPDFEISNYHENIDIFKVLVMKEINKFSDNSNLFTNKETNVIILDIIKLLDYGKEQLGNKFKIVDLNKIKSNYKGYDFLLSNGRKKFDIQISYKFIKGRSLSNTTFENLFLTNFNDIELNNDPLNISIEIDNFIKNRTNIVDLIIDKLEMSLNNPKILIENIKTNKFFNFLQDNIENYENYIVYTEEGEEYRSFIEINNFNLSIDKYIQFSLTSLYGNSNIKDLDIEEVLFKCSEFIKKTGYMSLNFVSNSRIDNVKYIVKELHRNELLRKMYEEDNGDEPYTLIFYNSLLKNIEENLTSNLNSLNNNDELKLKWFEDNLHVKQGDNIFLENNIITKNLDYNFIKDNISDIKIDISNFSITNFGINFDIQINYRDNIIFDLKKNILKSKNGMLIGNLTPDITNDVFIEQSTELLLTNEKTLKKDKILKEETNITNEKIKNKF